jgi:FixJ family two-component response regulator
MSEENLARILVLDADGEFRHAVRRVLLGLARIDEAESCAAADLLIHAGVRWCGLIAEVALPDGSGLDWLASARRTQKGAAALVLTSQFEVGLVNRAFDFGAHYACKPLPRRGLRAFAIGAIARGETQRDPIAAFTSHMSRVHELSRVEAELVEAAVRDGVQGKNLAAVRGVSANTLKTQVRGALRKLRARSLTEVRERVLRGIVTGER